MMMDSITVGKLSIDLVLLFVYSTLLGYLTKLETVPDCQCASSPLLKYIRYFYMIQIAAILVAMAFKFFDSPALMKHQVMLQGVFFTIGVTSFVLHYFAIRWVGDMIKAGCECSEDNRRSLLQGWSWFIVLSYLAAFLLPVFVVLSGPQSFLGKAALTAEEILFESSSKGIRKVQERVAKTGEDISGRAKKIVLRKK